MNQRRKRQKGTEVLEFALVLTPMLAIGGVMMDAAWTVFVKATLQRAVRVAVVNGATMTAAQLPAGSCLTQATKQIVQNNSAGLLKSDAGLSMIKVNYLQPPAPGSTAPATDVSATNNGNTPGNIMQVSVQNFPLIPLMPRIYGPGQPIDNSPIVLTVYSAGMIEPSTNLPCMGTAP